MSDDWPKMATTEWDEKGFAVPGTYPIAVVHLEGWGLHNEPMPSVESAACAYCDRWAVSFYVGVKQTVDGPFAKSIHRRMELTLIYVCDRHIEAACDELLETYGSCGSSLSDRLELALKVQEWNRKQAAEREAGQ